MPDASQAQYGPPTTTCVSCLTPPPPHELPSTGFALAWPLALAVVLVVTGVMLRERF